MVPTIRIGLPYSSNGRLAQEAQQLGAATLLSMGSMFRVDSGFTPIGLAAWTTPSALDSAGYTAMLQGGYRWTVAEHVEFVVTNSGDGSMPFPWAWWAAMDFCCEQKIAKNREEVERRVDLTISTYAETLAELDYWREEGDTETPDPIPTLQGRTVADYLRCARELAKVCRDGRLPVLVGVGSVCRRELHGPEGLLTILAVLHRELPAGVRLHLFGVKGSLLGHLERFGDRIASVDSMAWDDRARHDAHAKGVSNTVERRSGFMREWYERNHAAAQGDPAPRQLSMF